ncbi:hypothetical protein HDU77_002710 [Chytriomyces hyalinus]|nr:hypothetical protein HDU77_002710 [Chytriomyces hyalinus]
MIQAVHVPLVLFCAYLYFVHHGPAARLETKFFGLNQANAVVSGFTGRGYESLKAQMQRGFDDNDEVGSQFAAYVDGVLVADLHGGHTDTSRVKEYKDNTLVQVFSSSKFVTSLVFAHLVNTNQIQLNDTVCSYWSQFCAGNKTHVTLQELLMHRGGLAFLDPDRVPRPEHLVSLDLLAQRIAAQPHNFNGVPRPAYHAVTRGWFLNELARRATGHSVRDIMYNEIMPMLNHQDPNAHKRAYKRDPVRNMAPFEFHYGIPDTPQDLSDSVQSRVAPLDGPSLVYTLFHIVVPTRLLRVLGLFPIPDAIVTAFLNKNSYPNKALFSSGPDFTGRNGEFPWMYNDPTLRRSQSPSFNGLTNARSLAALAEHLRRSQFNENNVPTKGLISADLFKQNFHPDAWVTGYDLVIQNNLTFNPFGMGVMDKGFGAFKDGRIATDLVFHGWAGAGGSLVLFNIEYGISFAYTMNFVHLQTVGDKRSWRLIEEVVRIAKEAKQRKAALGVDKSVDKTKTEKLVFQEGEL